MRFYLVLITLFFLFSPVLASWKMNPFTNELDYYTESTITTETGNISCNCSSVNGTRLELDGLKLLHEYDSTGHALEITNNRGSNATFQTSSTPVNFYDWIGHNNQHSGFGSIQGSNIESLMGWIFSNSAEPNGFYIVQVDYLENPLNGTTIFSLIRQGHLWIKGNMTVGNYLSFGNSVGRLQEGSLKRLRFNAGGSGSFEFDNFNEWYLIGGGSEPDIELWSNDNRTLAIMNEYNGEGNLRVDDFAFIDTGMSIGTGGKNKPVNGTLEVVGSANITGDLLFGGSLISYSPLMLEDDVCIKDHVTDEWVRCGSYNHVFQCLPDEYCKKKHTVLEDKRINPEKYESCSPVYDCIYNTMTGLENCKTVNICVPVTIEKSNLDYYYSKLGVKP